jgi:oligogalacturonide lyase
MKNQNMSEKTPWTRRCFLEVTGVLGALIVTGRATNDTERWKLDDSFPSYRDAKTGVNVYNLTPGDAQDVIVYQTHPMWTPNMECLVFTSGGLVHALEMATGKMRPVLDNPATFSMQWNSGNLYYFQGRDLYRLDVPSAFRGTGKGEKVTTLPAEYIQVEGGLSVDATGDAVYIGALLEKDKRWGVAGFRRDGWHTLASVDFRVGHVQANPYVADSVMFCWETGGDSPQRTWVVDAKMGAARPVYREVNNEWVTHEVWWGRDRVIFTVWPYDDEHKRLPHGVAWTDLGSGQRNVLAQYPAWHAHGSPDGRWALGDDFERNIWLIHVATGERRLLTQGHLGGKWKTHPHASFTPDSRAIVLNSSRSGSEDILLVPLPQWESLPSAVESETRTREP